jgi:hypothetical protein
VRTPQIRLALDYYVAVRSTARRIYLRWADAALAAFLRLPTSKVDVGQRSFRTSPLLLQPSRASSAALMSGSRSEPTSLRWARRHPVYFEPRSQQFRDPPLRSLALGQLDVALALMTIDGRLPLTSARLGDYDTAYGHLTLMLVYRANRHWRSNRLDGLLIRALPWASDTVRSGMSVRFYPVYSESRPDRTSVT